jgi:hypothetical protein
MNVSGKVNAKKDILLNVDFGALHINGAIRSTLGDIKLNIFNNNLFINNKVVAEQGLIFADAYGDIKDDPLSKTAGVYANEVKLISHNGSIGTQDNRFKINNENPQPVTLNVSAVNGGIYLEGLDYGAKIGLLDSGLDLELSSNGDIEGAYSDADHPNIRAKNITLESVNGSIGTSEGRITVEPLERNGKVNLDAYSGIYVNQYKHIFLSDYVSNRGYGVVSLLVPDSHVVIRSLNISPDMKLEIDFIGRKYVKNVNIASSNIKKLTIHPAAVLYSEYRLRNPYVDLLTDYNKERIQNNMGQITSDNLLITLNIEQ